jgi:ferredoxin-thioredoxin reductase catalytic chain
LPEGHEGREIYGVVEDPHPDKGRALGRLEEKLGRKIDKSGGHQSSLPSGEGNVRPAANPPPDGVIE